VLPETAVPPAPVLPSDLVSLNVKFHPAGDHLAISYTVENQGKKEIWVLDVQVTITPPYGAPAVPRVLFEAPETVVVACWYGVPSYPPGTTWSAPPAFYGNRVAAQSQYRASLQLPLPLAGTDDCGTRDGYRVSCRYARFEVAVIPAVPGVSPVTVSGRQLGCLFSDTLKSRLLLASPPVPVNLPLVLMNP
jgi:hypothetical protein